MREFLHIVNNLLSKERSFLILLVTALTVIWFRKGLILGSGESGLPFYNTSRLLEVLKSNWGDVPLGAGGSIAFPTYPLYATITFFQQLNVPSFLLQAVMYWLIFVIGVLSIHKIASLIEGNSSLTRLASALFYIFNPIVHISVLHRFQYPLMFFYFFMPLAFLIYLQGLKSRNFIYLIILSLVSLIFSFSFVGLGFLELFFGVLALFTFSYFLSTFRKNRDFFPLLYFLGFVVIFMLINAWWLAPLFTLVFVDLGKTGTVKYFNPSDNVDTFKGISAQIESVLSVFRLFKPNAYLKDDTSWVWIYGTAPFIFLSFFSAVAFIVGLFKKEKELLYKFLILVALITMFWMKGTLAPFGGVTLYLFQSFTFLHAFRNPLEKIGMLLPFAMAIPVGFGTAIIINILASKLKLSKNIISFLILTMVFPVFMFPIVTGLAFTGGPPPANNLDIGQYVRVPDYYKQAREWLDQQEGLFRVIVLPIDGEGMTYKWEYGFSGVELSNNLFNHSMISLNTSQGYLPEIVDSIKEILTRYPKDLWVLAQLLNVKYIMVRDDVDYIARETEAPAVVLSNIKEYLGQHFSEVADFGKLKFFELNPAQFTPRVFASAAPVYLFDHTFPLKKGLGLIPFSNPQANEMFIVTSKSPAEDPYIDLAKKTVINGVRVENIKIDINNPIENLPLVSIYRDTPFYALVRLKEELEIQLQTVDTQLAFHINLLGKRLAEISHSPQDMLAIEEYYRGIKSIANELTSSRLVERVIIETLIGQREALEGIKKRTSHTNTINQIISDLDNLFVNVGAKSLYPTQKNLIHRFYVPKDSQYEILIPKEKWSYYFEDSEISEFDLDGKTIKLNLSQKKGDRDILSMGTYSLNLGIHEVSIAYPKGLNLIAEELPDELVLSSKDKMPITKTIPIAKLDNSYSYGLSFEYLEERGSAPIVVLNADVDLVDKRGEKIPKFGIALTRSDYDFGWKEYSGSFKPAPAAQEYSVSFKVLPYGNCKAVVERPYRRYCEDSTFSKRFLKDSSFKIRNLKIEKLFENPVMLREVDASSAANTAPKINFEQISPARYKVKVTNAQNPYFLVLSTTFDPRWNAYFTSSRPKNLMELLSDSISGDPISSDNHLLVNGYANAWYLEKEGSYEMFLEYSPERIFIIGQKFSLLIITASLLILMYRRYVKYNNR